MFGLREQSQAEVRILLLVFVVGRGCGGRGSVITLQGRVSWLCLSLNGRQTSKAR